MAKNETEAGSEKDWTNASAILQRRTGKAGAVVPQPVTHQRSQQAIVPAIPSRVPAELSIPSPDFSAERSVYQKWRDERSNRKLLVAHLAELHKGHMELLKGQVKEAVKIGMVGIAIRAKIVLGEMEDEYLNGMIELGIRNAKIREEGVSKLNDMICAKIEEVETKRWPQELKDRHIDTVWALQERVKDEIMMELGTQYSNE